MPSWPARAADTTVRDGLRRYPGQAETLPELLERAVLASPGAPAAAEAGGRALSYEQLWAEAEQVAAGLQRRHGVRPGDQVAFLSANGLDLLAGVIAAWRAGAVAVLLNPRYTAAEVAQQLAACAPRVVLVQAQWRDKVAGAAQELGHVRDTGFETPRTAEADPALIMFSSGTTGSAKPIVQSHGNLVSAAETWVRCLDLGPGDTTVVAAPMHHATGLNGQSLPLLATGGSLTILPRFDAPALVELLAAGAASFFHAAPAIYELALRAAGDARARGLRVAVSGGSFVGRPLVERVRAFAPGVDFRISYGMTETSSPAVLTPPGSIDTRPGDAAGVAVPLDDVRVDDEGEIHFRGATVVTGRDWLPSGDLGTIDAEGFVSVVDRRKDVINRGGEKISSLEVEAVLCAHPGVQEAAVVGAPDAVFGEVPHAFVVGDAGADALRAFAAQRLARFKVPVAFERVDELPRTAGGKVLKRELRRTRTSPAT